MKKNETLSIVICTHNRADLLRGAIQSVLGQDYPIENYELIIVDNNSTDFTRAIVEDFSSQHTHVRYIMETKIGLSHARNHGWKEAKGKYIGFLDDDCKVSSGWLSNALRVAKDIAPHAFGGPYYAFYNSPKPVWFKDEYGSHVQGDTPRALTENEYLDGGNMFIRRDLLVRYAGFHSELGMKGERIAFGEETYLLKRLRAEVKNSVLYYDPSVFVYHLVRAEKLDLWAAPKRFFISGMYANRINFDNARMGILRLLVLFVQVFLDIIWSFTQGLFARDKKKYPYFQNYIYEKTMRYFSYLGVYTEILRRLLKMK